MSAQATLDTEMFQPAGLVGPESSGKLRVSRSLPTLQHLYGNPPTGSSPASDSAKRAHTIGASPELRHSLDPQHIPGPDALDAAQDYLAEVKARVDRVEPNLYERRFGKNVVQGHGEVYLIGQPGTARRTGLLLYTYLGDPRLRHPDMSEWNREKLQILSEEIENANEECPCVLIVEAIDRDGIQTLGTALHLDPVFLAHHITGNLDDKPYVKLKAACSNCAAGGNPIQNLDHHEDHAQFGATDRMHIEGLHMNRHIFKKETGWSFTYPRRVDELGQTMPMMSICRVASHAWLILVDPPLPMMDTTQAPFASGNRLDFDESGYLPATYDYGWRGSEYRSMWQFHLARCLRAGLDNPAARRLLFELHGVPCNDQSQASVLIAITSIAAWQDNVSHIRRTLGFFRHHALATPSMQTFSPLTLLRRNIADLENSILIAKERQSTETKEVFERRRKTLGSKLQSLDDQYDALLQQVKDMSNTLNNEIQLVIGAVTVQDSDIMKRQGRRATVLTLLASIYLPLSLVTSIFGMNIQEITKDGSNPVGRQAAIVFGVVAGATVLFFLLYLLWHFVHKRIRHLRRRGEEEVYKMA